MQKTTTIVLSAALCVSYLLLVRLQRWSRYRRVHQMYSHRDVTTLSPQEAQQIIHLSSMWDMPGLMNIGVSFALFKTYGIPTISKLLVQTKELGSVQNVSKRYSDTEILISAWMLFPISNTTGETGNSSPDSRASIAIARTNWLHSHYSISNDDYLYTLCLFILEPITWARNFGWRQLSNLESHAYFIFWSEVGSRMGITDIPKNLAELERWSDAYELKHMVPAKSNHDVAAHTMNEMLHALTPRFGIRNFFLQFGYSLLDERVRIAMIQPKALQWIKSLVNVIVLSTFRYIPLYFCLPRRTPNTIMPITIPHATDGRMNAAWCQAKPWYRPEPQSAIGRVFSRVAVILGLYDDVPGVEYRSGGFRIEELGPTRFEKLGHEEVMQMAEKFHGCPIQAPFALPRSQCPIR